MGIPGGLAHGLVSRGLHNLARGRAGHSEPGAECVSQPVPGDLGNSGFNDTGLQPRAVVEPLHIAFAFLVVSEGGVVFTWEDTICRLLIRPEY